MCTAQVMIEQPHQLVGGALHRLGLACRMLRYRDRLTPLQTRLQHAALVMLAALAAVLVAQVTLAAGDSAKRASACSTV